MKTTIFTVIPFVFLAACTQSPEQVARDRREAEIAYQIRQDVLRDHQLSRERNARARAACIDAVADETADPGYRAACVAWLTPEPAHIVVAADPAPAYQAPEQSTSSGLMQILIDNQKERSRRQHEIDVAQAGARAAPPATRTHCKPDGFRPGELVCESR